MLICIPAAPRTAPKLGIDAVRRSLGLPVVERPKIVAGTLAALHQG